MLTKQRYEIIIHVFGGLQYAWEKATTAELQQAGFSAKSAQTFVDKRQKIDTNKLTDDLHKCGAQLLTWTDERYPVRLREIADPPVALLYRGQLPSPTAASLAIVGSRQTSPACKQILTDVVPPLSRAGLTIVSGLAAGVDALAHDATLQAHGVTVAVLGNGIDHIYPSANRQLGQQIITQGGCIFSEYVPGTQPLPHYFPMRNRIVSGLSLGTLIVAGKAKSGSLITAEQALEQGRDVFAVPHGPYDPLGAAPLGLVKRGEAKLITSAEDILEEYDFLQKTTPETSAITITDPTQQTVYSLLTKQPQPTDELIRQSDLPASQLTATLTLLEMQSLAQNLEGNLWVRR